MTTGAESPPKGMLQPPAELLSAAKERCRELAEAASGRVLELPQDDMQAVLANESAKGTRYDTILSFMRSHQVDDLRGFVAALDAVLADGGWIYMVEPSAAGAAGGLLEILVPRRVSRRSSAAPRAGRDVVSALRSGGFMVTDLNRCEAPSAPARWRNYVQLRARRETPWSSETPS